MNHEWKYGSIKIHVMESVVRCALSSHFYYFNPFLLVLKANNVPKENIENSVKRGMDAKTSVNMENVQYEGGNPFANMCQSFGVPHSQHLVHLVIINCIYWSLFLITRQG